MNTKFKDRLKKQLCALTALSLSAVMVFSLASCSKGTDIDSVKIPNSFTYKETKKADKSYHTGNAQKLKKIAASGLVELYFDESNFTVSVKDTTYSKMWNSLPEEENENAAPATVEIIKGDKKYLLNTQDNSVAFNKAKVETKGESIIVTYILTPDKKTADKKKYSPEDIAFELKITYTLADGSLNVSAKSKNLVKESTAKITKLNLLPYFGAQKTPTAGDFIFVPDGSGALIKTDVADESFKKPLNFAVYGNDLSLTKKQKNYSAIVPAYGMKQGNSAFVILITKGDALAEIEADRVREGNDFFKVGSTFNLTPYSIEKGKKNSKLYVSDETYKNEVSLCVRFLNGSNANYTGMAAAAREQFIREHVLSTKTVKESEYLPLELSIIGAADSAMFKMGKFAPSKLKKLTTFEEAQDMISRMKAMGINGMNVIYKGILSGGLNQGNAANASVLRRLGSKNALQELCDFAEAQNMGIFLDINLLSANIDKSFPSGKTAGNIFGDKASYTRDSEIKTGKIIPSYESSLIKTSSIKKEVVELLGNKSMQEFTGFCVSDAGSILYSDFAQNRNRQQNAKTISDEITPLTAGKTLVTHKGNFFMIKDVEFISHLPSTTQVEENEAYVSVPFVQLILHGIIEYSNEPVNYSENTKDAMLKCIEYGACPSYEVTYKNISGKKDDIYFYENWITPAAEFYARANEALVDIRSSRMTSHEEIAPDVFCTEYNSGEKIYVNYTEEDVVVSGLTIPANDFLRIN